VEKIAPDVAKGAGPSDSDRALLRDSIRGFFARHWSKLPAAANSPDAQAIATLWRELAAQGLTSLGADPAYGGLRELILLFHELGRASCPAPLLGAVTANLVLAPLCVDGSNPAVQSAAALLSDLSEGKAIVAAAFGAQAGDPSAGSVTVHGEGSRCALDGRLAHVEGAAGASHFIVFTDVPVGIALMDADTAGLSLRATPGLMVPPLSELRLQQVSATRFNVDPAVTSDVVFTVRLACAARALGAAQRSFELAVENAKARRQFNRVIGQFQAIQHKLADCLIGLEGAQLTLERAAEARDTGSGNWRVLGSAALGFASPAIRRVSVQAILALGAIGYAEAHEAPWHFRRVHADLARFGGAPRARAELAELVLARPPKTSRSKAGANRAKDDDPARDAAGVFRQQFRAWLATHWTEERCKANGQRPFKDRHWDPEFSRIMGRDGWIGVHWPKEYGGQARGVSEQIAYVEELVRAQVPYHAHNIGNTIVARALFAHGTREQKAEFLPEIRRGERYFSLGYSEPEAGSDLASLRSRAVRDGDDWIINGQKLWTTNADKSEYVWFAARTNPDGEQHAGISVFIVKLSSPGITIQPGMALHGRTFSTVFYENVRVPATAIVGGVNNGWKVITGALIEELVMLGGMHQAIVKRAFGILKDHIRTTKIGGKPMRKDPVICDRIGAIAAEVEVAEQLLVRNTRLADEGRVTRYEAAVSKVFLSELQERLGQAALDILGTNGLLSDEALGAPIGEMEQVLRHSMMPIIGGGTNEIHRTQIALRGLGLPR
jgi:alkylation response protein AidB-like acyl-CoA dehydrogenase